MDAFGFTRCVSSAAQGQLKIVRSWVVRILCILIFLGFRSYVTIRSKRIADVCSMLFMKLARAWRLRRTPRLCNSAICVWAGAWYAALSMMGGIVTSSTSVSGLRLRTNSSKFTDHASPRRNLQLLVKSHPAFPWAITTSVTAMARQPSRVGK
jgi:hypothetical protein